MTRTLVVEESNTPSDQGAAGPVYFWKKIFQLQRDELGGNFCDLSTRRWSLGLLFSGFYQGKKWMDLRHVYKLF